MKLKMALWNYLFGSQITVKTLKCFKETLKQFYMNIYTFTNWHPIT